jgi:hypothetical protein
MKGKSTSIYLSAAYVYYLDHAFNLVENSLKLVELYLAQLCRKYARKYVVKYYVHRIGFATPRKYSRMTKNCIPTHT